MMATLELRKVTEWLTRNMEAWKVEAEKSDSVFWNGKLDALRQMQDAVMNGQFNVDFEQLPEAPSLIWERGDRIEIIVRDLESNLPVARRVVSVFDEHENQVTSLWSGDQGCSHYSLRSADLDRHSLNLRFETPGYLRTSVEITHGRTSVVVAMARMN